MRLSLVAKLIVILLFAAPLAASAQAAAPAAPVDDCGSCIENCIVDVHADRVSAYCDLFHQPRGYDVGCDGCPQGWIVTCYAYHWEYDGCYMSNNTSLHQCWEAAYGLEQGLRVCMDTGSRDCKASYESWAGMHYSKTCVPGQWSTSLLA